MQPKTYFANRGANFLYSILALLMVAAAAFAAWTAYERYLGGHIDGRGLFFGIFGVLFFGGCAGH